LTIALKLADDDGIAVAIRVLGEGRLVIHPTETVTSLSGDPYHTGAVDAARRIKGYHKPRPFVCLVKDAATARSSAAAWNPAAEELAAALWPGPLTLIVVAAEGAPAAVTVDDKLAMRPAVDPVSQRLVTAWGGPLFSTSANRRGLPPSTSVEVALQQLSKASRGNAIGVALTATHLETVQSVTVDPSSIVDVTEEPPRLVREGAIGVAELRAIRPDIRL
jgi:L-threonylcarbamoyladenylate synthase